MLPRKWRFNACLFLHSSGRVAGVMIRPSRARPRVIAARTRCALPRVATATVRRCARPQPASAEPMPAVVRLACWALTSVSRNRSRRVLTIRPLPTSSRRYLAPRTPNRAPAADLLINRTRPYHHDSHGGDVVAPTNTRVRIMMRSLPLSLSVALLVAVWGFSTGCDSPSTNGPAQECGDSVCEQGETCATCQQDCGACNQPACGDGGCNGSETCLTCAADCGSCNLPGCGDGHCTAPEACGTCVSDCGACGPICGDGACNGGETSATCAADCPVSAICGDGACNSGETSATCAADCPVSAICGDGTCNGSETTATCAADCPAAIVCGDGKCQGNETTATCAADCPAAIVCGDGKCQGNETTATCAADCPAAIVCGDGKCQGNETTATCAADCPAAIVCGDGKCQGNETTATCAADCPAAVECDGDFLTGSTFVRGEGTAWFAACDGIPPSNCPRGVFIMFSNPDQCVCVVPCDDLVDEPMPGQGCTAADPNIVCRHILGDTGNQREVCVPNDWNLCVQPGTPAPGGN